MFLSITGVTADNKLAKYQGFDSENDAIAHAVNYNGFAIEDPNTDKEFWVIDKSAKTITLDTSTQTSTIAKRVMANIRAKRDALLAATDWTGNSDVTMSDAMTAYRTALRDYPATYAADNSAAWPTLGD